MRAGEARNIERMRSLIWRLTCAVCAVQGQNSLLYHRLLRAYHAAEQEQMHDALRLYRLQPEDARGLICAAMPPAEHEETTPPRVNGRRGHDPKADGHYLAFDVDGEGENAVVRRTRLGVEPDRALRVLIRPGTLPSTAARSLRRIAERIERDRTVLSERTWRKDEQELG